MPRGQVRRNADDWTTLSIKVELKDRLENLREHPDEKMQTILNRIVAQAEERKKE